MGGSSFEEKREFWNFFDEGVLADPPTLIMLELYADTLWV